MNSNPFTIIFGMKPQSIIPRNEETRIITEAFESERPISMGYVITGVRGCGKTVLMTSIQNYFAEKKDWYVLRLNPDIDLYSSAISQLSEFISLKDEKITGINASFAGFGGGIILRSLSDNETLLRRMLKEAAKRKKRVLIAIDEASNTKNIKVFSHSYQAFIGENLPVFLLMTSLPENFSSLSNSKNGTFIRRLPKVKLAGLSNLMIEEKYREILSITQDKAITLSKIVMGYPYAFQLLGSLLWESKKDTADEGILGSLDTLLFEGSYQAIWNHLTEKEKLIMQAIAHSSDMSVKDIRNKTGMEQNQFSPYREKLRENGLINTETYGKLSFSLPRFREFVIHIEQYMI
ncbi:MAG: ATP-binding protein [Lachnospiraceae bacterium]|nr:ATP-binding protein [Lachnospiraceae bacterium]